MDGNCSAAGFTNQINAPCRSERNSQGYGYRLPSRFRCRTELALTNRFGENLHIVSKSQPVDLNGFYRTTVHQVKKMIVVHECLLTEAGGGRIAKLNRRRL
jgi:hypothetical protein